MTLDRDRCEALPNDRKAKTKTLDTCLEDFRKMMEEWAKGMGLEQGWEESLQVTRLLDMADPAAAERWPGRLTHMVLDPGAPRARNDFVHAKREGLVLAPYGDPAREAERPPIAPKSRWRPTEPAPPGPSTLPGPAPSPAANLLRPAGTPVEFAGAPGRLAEPLFRGMTVISVVFEDGEIEPIPVAALAVSEREG